MAAKRERPFAQFNFLVDLGDGVDPNSADGGFQECSNVGMEVTVAEYRNGNDPENSVRKITGLNKATDVTLKRGVIGSARLYTWLNAIRDGDANQVRDAVRIRLMSEDHRDTVATWVLKRARIIKYVSGPFNAKGTDVAMEELTIAYERMELEDAV